ncbi:MFS transporter [Streptomyces indicus]|uniref:Major Facilitator Superfamily protein n=1 Tax=Streptomyces indicus TaxID=417292 RepID=A0A1G9HEN4_9ACTN|nr:MFS transporter [Streptomyces indicus]SDL11322.1 Major Facilitator Superfamily protein [Streptomyces indicus]
MPTAAHTPAHRGKTTLAVVLLGLFTLPMAMSGTTVALPDIGADLDASGAALNWVVTGYFLAASSFMLVAGSLGDLFGRRRLFSLGALVYTAATVLSATSQNILLLDLARILVGVGAAGVMATGTALLASTFEGAARTKAFALGGTTASVGLSLGPTVSGAIVDGLGWRTTFLVFAAAGAVILLGSTALPDVRAEARPKVDKAGAVTFIAGLALTLFAITQGSKDGWLTPSTLLPLALGLGLLVSFVRIERRISARGGHPILDLALTRNRRFLAWPLGTFALGTGSTAVMVFLPTYLQGTSGYSAREAGLVLLFLSVPMAVLPQLGGRLVNRGLQARTLLLTSLLLIVSGNLWLGTVLHAGISTAALAAPVLLIGAGSGLSLGLVDAQALALVEPSRTGMASGFLTTVRGGTAAVMLTLFGTLLLALLTARTGSAEAAGRISSGVPQSPVQAGQFSEALRLGIWAVAGLVAVLAVVVWALSRPRPDSGPATNPAVTADLTKTDPAPPSKATTLQTR